MGILWQFFRAFRRPSTYDPRHNYFLLVGFLTGLSAPVVSVSTHLYSLQWSTSVWQLLRNYPFHWAFMFAPFVFALLFGGLGAVRISEDAKLGRLLRRLAELSTTDELTGLSNARHFQTQLDRELDRARRQGGVFSLVLFDLDGFKRINDTRGHPNGDVALREVARLTRSCQRRYDTAARLGGDEFALILAGAHRDDALRVADRIRVMLAGHGFLATHSQGSCSLTASFGVATYPENGPEKAAVIAAADRALYEGKARGGNAVCAAEQPALRSDDAAQEDTAPLEGQEASAASRESGVSG